MKLLHWLGCCGAIILTWIAICFCILPLFVEGSWIEAWDILLIPNPFFKNNYSIWYIFMQIGTIIGIIFGTILFWKNNEA
jgi:hypothetical protein